MADDPQHDADPKTRRWPWSEAALLEGLTPETAHADEIATPTAREFGQEKTDASL